MQISLPNEILLEEVASLLAEGRDVELMAKGTSMLPFIVGGRDSVVLRKRAGESLRPGDIVLARRSPGNYVLHRIIDMDGEMIVLRGDGNVGGTEVVGGGDILGKVIGIVGPCGRKHSPGSACLWRHLSSFTRRCVLALYRRTIYRIIVKDED